MIGYCILVVFLGRKLLSRHVYVGFKYDHTRSFLSLNLPFFAMCTVLSGYPGTKLDNHPRGGAESDIFLKSA